MVSPALFPAFLKDVPALCGYASSPDAAIGVCDSPAVYRPRDPRAGDLFALVEDNFDELERVWDERYERQHGFWRPIIRHVVEQYMDCGDLRCGFARVRCSACRSEYLLAFSCKRRYFCPSCHQKRVVLFAERVEQEVLQKVPVRQYVVTIPKMLRIFFKHDRKLLGLLSQCFYQSVKQCFREVSPDQRAVPGMIASIQTYGNDLGPFHPHLYVLSFIMF